VTGFKPLALFAQVGHEKSKIQIIMKKEKHCNLFHIVCNVVKNCFQNNIALCCQ